MQNLYKSKILLLQNAFPASWLLCVKDSKINNRTIDHAHGPTTESSTFSVSTKL